MDDHASKPIDSDTIAEILARHIGGVAPARPAPAIQPEPEPETAPPVGDFEPDHLVPTVRV
jgi:hypothetical protein